MSAADGSAPRARPTVAVFDVDGVVADVRHRLHHLDRRPKDWDGFFAAAGDDPVLSHGRTAVDLAAQGHAVVYLTGRPVALEGLTRAWLEQHALPRGRLLMRPAHDRRPARLVKVAAVRRLARSAEVAMVVDDDPAVVAALVAAGFPAHLADWMSRDHDQPDLFEAQEVDGRT